MLELLRGKIIEAEDLDMLNFLIKQELKKLFSNQDKI